MRRTQVCGGTDGWCRRVLITAIHCGMGMCYQVDTRYVESVACMPNQAPRPAAGQSGGVIVTADLRSADGRSTPPIRAVFDLGR